MSEKPNSPLRQRMIEMESHAKLVGMAAARKLPTIVQKPLREPAP